MNTNCATEIDALIESLREIGDNLEGEPITNVVQARLGELARLANSLHRQNCWQPTAKSISLPNDPALVELNERLALVRDRVRGVAKQGQAGFYLYGRAGTSKTRTVRTTLDDLCVKYHYENGHLTPIGLFEAFEQFPNDIFVLDDVGEIFKQPTAKGILLAALGSQPDGMREIRYKRKGKTAKVRFTGGVIAISNLELHGDELITAIKSRVQTLNFNPTDGQIAALMREISTKGSDVDGDTMSPPECQEVCEFLLEQCQKREVRPDVRMLVDKAFKDFMLWRMGESESHWHDLINSALEDQLVTLTHPVDLHVPTKQEEEATELDKLEEIVKQFSTHDERLDAFVTATGKSKRTYQRRMRQLKAMGRLPINCPPIGCAIDKADDSEQHEPSLNDGQVWIEANNFYDDCPDERPDLAKAIQTVKHPDKAYFARIHILADALMTARSKNNVVMNSTTMISHLVWISDVEKDPAHTMVFEFFKSLSVFPDQEIDELNKDDIDDLEAWIFEISSETDLDRNGRIIADAIALLRYVSAETTDEHICSILEVMQDALILRNGQKKRLQPSELKQRSEVEPPKHS